MSVEIRVARPDDVADVGRFIYSAFKGIAEKHNFRPDFPSPEAASQLAGMLLTGPAFYGVVAEDGGRAVGSNFLWEFDGIRAVGPITVDPTVQGRGVGRRLMEAVLDRARGADGVRLVQDAFNTTSLSLYASLGFDVKEPLALVEGDCLAEPARGLTVRPLEPGDLEACEALCAYVTGFERANELRNLPPISSPYVAYRGDYLVAYATSPTAWPLNHAAARSNEDMYALLAGAARQAGAPLSLLVPTRNAELFRWCLASGLRVVKPLNLMAIGAYRETTGCYIPSVGY